MRFFKGSSDSLASNLDDDDRKRLRSEFNNQHLELLRNKDPYPYEWIDDVRKFNYPRLPPESVFIQD